MMSMGLTNGRGSVALEDEWAGEAAGFETAFEDESAGESAGFETSFEDELTGEAAGFETSFEDELTGESAGFETSLEDEWSGEAAGFETSFEDELTGEAAGLETSFEDELTGEAAGFETSFESPAWSGEGTFETAFEVPEWSGETGSYEGVFEDEAESDQFLPFLAPLAMKALPMVAKFALPAVKKLLPVARQAIGRVVRNVTSTPVPPALRPGIRTFMRGLGAPMPRGPIPRRQYAYRPYPRPMPYSPPSPMGPPPGPMPGGGPFPQPMPQPPMSLGTILRGLSQVLNLGDAVAQEAEANLFGTNELQAELASHEMAHEAALTEVLAAEAAHATTEAEAESLLGSALPITIRIMSGSRATRSLTPTLTRANARLVSSLRRSGPGGPQLLRAVPAIQRRTIATIREARRRGRPVGHRMVGPIMAAQAARVLGSPHTCGKTLVRNVAIRQGTVAPAGRIVRPVRA